MLVEGKAQYVFYEHGRRYLDGLGGIVTISGSHCRADVVAAARRQNELSQTFDPDSFAAFGDCSVQIRKVTPQFE